MKNKIADSMFNKLSDLLSASAEDLLDFASIDKVDEYTELSEKRGVIRRITLLVDGDATSIRKAVKDKKAKVLSDDILKDVNRVFTDIITSKKTKPTEKKVTKQNIKNTRAAVRTASGRFTSLVTLKDLLNEQLADKIRDNMGKGNAKAILNYRTGRFASSAEVRQLTLARDGALTAFYTYMKYPYQTFEPGFKQGSPKSRDPRLLIGKSIRQLAVQLTLNKLKVEPI